jgi:hypothetical protein
MNRQGLSRLAVSLFAVASAACTLHTTETSSDEAAIGQVAGLSFSPRSALARFTDFVGVSSDGKTTLGRGLEILISDKPNTCETLHLKSSSDLVFKIPGDDIAPATFDVVDVRKRDAGPGEVEARFFAADKACRSIKSEAAVTGLVRIDRMATTVVGQEPSTVHGAFIVQFATGVLSAPFNAVVCPKELESSEATDAPSCIE